MVLLFIHLILYYVMPKKQILIIKINLLSLFLIKFHLIKYYQIDCVLINTGYSFLDGYLNIQNNKINHKIKSLHFQSYVKDIFDILNANKVFDELLNIFPKLSISRNVSNADRIFNSRLKLSSTFYNIKKMTSILNIDNEAIKYKYWMNPKSNYDNDILYNNMDYNKKDDTFYLNDNNIEMDNLLLQQDKELENLINKVNIRN